MSVDDKPIIDKQLKKHVNAIHCSNEISLLQRKLFNALTYIAYPNLLKQQIFEIQTKDLCKLIGYNSNDIAKIRDALSHLMSTVIHWSIVSFDKQNKDEINEKTLYWEASTMLAAAKIKGGVCSYEFSSILKVKLYHPERYARLDMNIISQLKSKYSLALYENAIRFQGLKFTPKFEIEDFRTIMGANILNDKGQVEIRKYKDYKDFKKRVIDPGIIEINKNTDIFLELEEERNIQNKVIRVRFKQSKKIDVEVTKKLNMANKGIAYIQDTFGISENNLNKLEKEYGLDYLREKTKLIIGSKSYQNGKIKDLSSYFIAAVKGNYMLKNSNKIVMKDDKTRKSEIILQKNRTEIDSVYKEYLLKIYSNYIGNQSIDVINEIRKSFKNNLRDTDRIRFTMFEKFGFENIIIQDYFREYVISSFAGKDKVIQTMQQYEEQYVDNLLEKFEI